MSIKPLPGDVVAQIKSSVAITSLNNVICGLIKNSLDAEANKINITVEYSRGNCSVEDDGIGIPPSEFKETGGLGQLHYTSKYPPHPDIHGRYGIFLASVASLSLLSVSSHHQDYHSHNSMSIHNSKFLTRHTPCLPEQRILTFSHGTRVTVRDLFGCMPVRVKHRALQAEKSSFSREWDRLLLDVVALLIAWPGPASVSMRETSTRQTIILKTGAEPSQWVNDSCRILHQASLCDSPDASDWVSIGATAPTLSISGYMCRGPVATKRVQFISLGIAPLSNEFRCNVLYEEVNKVFAESSFGAIEDENDQGGAESEVKMEGFTGRELKTRKGVDRWPMFFLKISPTAPATKRHVGVDDILDDRQPNLLLIIDLLKAMFYEFLKKNHCRPKAVILSNKTRSRHDPAIGKSSTLVEAASRASVRTKSDSLESSRLSSAREPARETPRLEISDSRSESPFAARSGVKSGKTLQTFKERTQLPSRTQSESTTLATRTRNSTPSLAKTERSRPVIAEPSRPPLYDANSKLTQNPFADIDPKGLLSRSPTREPRSVDPPPHSPQDETIGRINPATKMVTTVSSGPGFVLPPKHLTLSRRASEKSSEASDTAHRGTTDTRDTTPWVRDLISKWKNPVFELAEPPIPRLPDVSNALGFDPKPSGHHCNHGLSFNAGTRHEKSAMELQGRLSKGSLSNAELIAQVDRKFILAKLPLDRTKVNADDGAESTHWSSVLVLIDQHAADERCRVEGLMKDYFEPTTDGAGSRTWKTVSEALPKPVQFELSGQDKDLLRRFQGHFEYWGICYDVLTPDAVAYKATKATRSKAKVAVRRLPPAILERCRTEPRLLAELIRKEAWRLNDEVAPIQMPKSRVVFPEEVEDGPAVWVSLFHGCPQGILELINSRACRSAIMFNDPLTLDQCSQLLGRLVRCAFPFQCAHGRPSMVPVVDLGDSMVEIWRNVEETDRVRTKESFAMKFSNWKKARQ